jgi:8-oxo-dGTP diphosphatase
MSVVTLKVSGGPRPKVPATFVILTRSRYDRSMSPIDKASFPRSAVTVDLVVLTIRDDALCGLVKRRELPPHKGRWALPGGFVHPDEGIEQAAARELSSAAGLTAADVHIEQLASYGDPQRDPRMRVITVAYLALAPGLPAPRAGGAAQWKPIADLVDSGRRLAFDHRTILLDGLDRARAKLEYTPLGSAFCAPEFTVAELRHVYEIVWDVELDPRNFHRKVTRTAGFLEATGTTTTRDGGRPAQLFRRGHTTLLHPPLLRTIDEIVDMGAR